MDPLGQDVQVNPWLVLIMVPASAAAHLLWRLATNYMRRWSQFVSIAGSAALTIIVIAVGLWLFSQSESLGFGYLLGAGLTPLVGDLLRLRRRLRRNSS